MKHRFHEVNITCPRCHTHRILTDGMRIKCVCGYKPRHRKASDWAILQRYGS